MMKDAVRLTRNERLSQERSPGGRGRVMKKKRCTPIEITKISHVSTLKQLFEHGRKDCVSESDALIRTGPRQAVKLDFGVGQDWRKQARLEGGEPMGDAVPGDEGSVGVRRDAPSGGE